MAWAVRPVFWGIVFFIKILPLMDKSLEVSVGHSIIDIGQGGVEELPAEFENGIQICF